MPKPLKTRCVRKLENIDLTWYLICSRPIGPPRNLTFSFFVGLYFTLHSRPCKSDHISNMFWNLFKNDAKMGAPKSSNLAEMGPLGRLAGRQQPPTFFYACRYTFLPNIYRYFVNFVSPLLLSVRNLSRTLARRYTGLPAQYLTLYTCWLRGTMVGSNLSKTQR